MDSQSTIRVVEAVKRMVRAQGDNDTEGYREAHAEAIVELDEAALIDLCCAWEAYQVVRGRLKRSAA